MIYYLYISQNIKTMREIIDRNMRITCMCICALTCIYVHLFDCICGGASVCGMHACVCAHIHPHTYMCMKTCVHIYTCLCGMHAYTNVHVNTCMCGVCAFLCVYMYANMRSETRWERQSALLVFLFPSTLLLLQFVTSPSDHVQAPFAPGLCKMLPGTHSGSTHPRCLPAVT